MRAAAAASSSASGVRSPIAIASPAKPSKSASVIAQSATGSCHGPTIWSRAVRPPTVRSPMVTRKFFDATVGCASTRRPASRRSSAAVVQLAASAARGGVRGVAVHLRRLAEQHVHRQVDRAWPGALARGAVRDDQALFGGGVADDRERATLARADRLELRDALRRDAEHVALLRFVAPQLHRRQRRIVARNLARSITPPTPESCSSSGIAFDRPPAPTSCTDSDRVVVAERDAAVDHFLAATLHLRVVALHRGEIEVFGAVARRHRTDAAPPPRPISIAGPPSTITASPGAQRAACSTCSRSIAPRPPASMIGLS